MKNKLLYAMPLMTVLLLGCVMALNHESFRTTGDQALIGVNIAGQAITTSNVDFGFWWSDYNKIGNYAKGDASLLVQGTNADGSRVVLSMNIDIPGQNKTINGSVVTYNAVARSGNYYVRPVNSRGYFTDIKNLPLTITVTKTTVPPVNIFAQPTYTYTASVTGTGVSISNIPIRLL